MPLCELLNGRRLDVAKIGEHISCDGFLKNYITWAWHDELLDIPSVPRTHEFFDWAMDNRLENMIHDVRV